MRSLVNKVFTPRAIAKLEPMIRKVIDTIAQTIDVRSFDMVEDFSALFPVEIITTMLGCRRTVASRSGTGSTHCWNASPETSARRRTAATRR